MAIQHLNGVMSDQQDWFHYSRTRKMWSRVLVRGGIEQGFRLEIAVPLTPRVGYNNRKLNKYLVVGYPDIAVGDTYTHVLPQEVFDYLQNSLEFDDWSWLMDKDLLRSVDLGKLVSVDGYIPYSEVTNNGYGDKGWLTTLKSIPGFFSFPTVMKRFPSPRKLDSLREKFAVK